MTTLTSLRPVRLLLQAVGAANVGLNDRLVGSTDRRRLMEAHRPVLGPSSLY